MRYERSLDHLVGADEDGLREGEAQGLGGLEVEDQLEARGLLDGQVSRVRLPILLGTVRAYSRLTSPVRKSMVSRCSRRKSNPRTPSTLALGGNV